MSDKSFDWNNLVTAATGVSNNWSSTVSSGREKKEDTKKYAVSMAVVAVVVIAVAIVIAVMIKNKR